MNFSLNKILFTTFLLFLLFIPNFQSSMLFSQEKDQDLIELRESNDYTRLDLSNYDIDDISNITSSDDKIFINFTSDKTILSYDINGNLLKEIDISNSLAVSIVINDVRTNEYDSYLYYFQVFNNINFYMFDNMNNIIYNFDNEFNNKSKRKLFVEDQFRIEPVKLSKQFYTPTYNSLLFFDKYSNIFYLVENGGYTKLLQVDYEVKKFYFDKSSQQIFIYNNEKNQIDLYTLRGIFIKTIDFITPTNDNDFFENFISADKNEIVIKTRNNIYSLLFDIKDFKLSSKTNWKKMDLTESLKINADNIVSIFNINIKNKNKFILKTEDEIILLK